jgi:hypothetical protein
MQPGAWLRFVDKIEPSDEEEASLKKEVKKLSLLISN